MTRTGPGRELSYQVQPILCASAVQRQWIVESVQNCAKFTLDKSRYKCFVKWLLLHSCLQTYNSVKDIQSFVQIIQHFQLLQLWRVLQEKVGQCQGLEFQSSVHHSTHRDCSSPHLTALICQSMTNVAVSGFNELRFQIYCFMTPGGYRYCPDVGCKTLSKYPELSSGTRDARHKK